ncbi:MAG: flagellar hook protein FlgE [Deltaproteobacteria bacterium]|nr:MAG: flagellar hook protein FlgE [Deltaproteobacteria bacterium]
MSLMTSLFTGISGINANGIALSVIGNNIANSNTVGYKSSRTIFGEVLSQTLGGSSSMQIGRGVNVQAVEALFTQGSFETTSNPLDMAIEGDGFFILRDPNGAIFYSRAGQFHVDKDGNIVNPEGLQLQGYLISQSGQLGTINVASINSPPNATTRVDISANLDSREVILPAFDVNNPDNTSNFSTSLTVYDSLGNSHLVTVYFRKAVEAPTGNTWEWYAVVPGTDTVSGVAEVQAQGTLDFDNTGALVQESPVTYPLGGFNFSGGAAPNQAIAFDFGQSITEGGSGVDGTTQFGAPSSVLFQNQDGYTAGSLYSLVVGNDGIITGVFTNGQTRDIAQVALARFIAPTALAKVGRNLYSESAASGQPIIGTPGTSGRGSLISNSLEMSNVDLADEFVKMIAAQRGFQANARVVTATDDLLTELMNIRR